GRFVLGGMNTIDRARIDTGGVFVAKTGCRNDIGHVGPFPFPTLLPVNGGAVLLKHAIAACSNYVVALSMQPSNLRTGRRNSSSMLFSLKRDGFGQHNDL